MQFINDTFPAILTKMATTKVEGDLKKEITFTYSSKNDPNQDFLDTFAEEYQCPIHKNLVEPEWDSITYSKTIPHPVLDIVFDSGPDGGKVSFKARLKSIKISKKETANDIIFKYDLAFLKEQDKDLDAILEHYYKYEEENEDGKMEFVLYDVEINN